MFLFLEQGEDVPECYQEACLRTIHKVEQDLQRKARCVTRGYLVNAHDINSYSSNMKGVSARLLIIIADANVYDVRVGDVKNAYLCLDHMWPRVLHQSEHRWGRKEHGRPNSPYHEGSVWTEIKWPSVARFFSYHLKGMEFIPSRFDPDVWYWISKEVDFFEYIGTRLMT
jgi:hypothetical protein